jgi:hypothetical protein
MKKISLFFASFLLGFVSSGQQYSLFVEQSCSDVGVNSVDILGGTHAISSNGIEFLDVSFYLKNNSGSSQTIQLSRSDICVDPAWVNHLVWEPACHDPLFSGMHVSDNTINNNWQSQPLIVQQDSLARIVAELSFNSVNSNGVYRSYIYASNTLIDSVDLKINGGCYLEGFEAEQFYELVVYPNPADEQLTLSTSGLTSSALIRLTDVSGKMVREEVINSEASLRTDDLKDGVYLITIIDTSTTVQTRRIVVKH